MTDLPYFNFYVSDYLAGDIMLHDMATQGVFVNLCCQLWKKGGYLPYNITYLARLLRIDYEQCSNAIAMLEQDCIIAISDDKQCYIKFIVEQIEQLSERHGKRVEAGRKGGLSKGLATASNAKAMLKPGSSNQNQNQNQNQKKEIHCSPQAKGLADRLRALIQSQKNVKIDARKLTQWAKCIHSTAQTDGIDFERQESAMAWYEENAGGAFVPVIESGKSWREKFLRLEAAAERGNDPYAVITEPYRPTTASRAQEAKEDAEQKEKADEAERSAQERMKILKDLHERHPEWQR